MLTKILKTYGRNRPEELMTALLALSPDALVKGIVKLFSSGELRFRTKRRIRKAAQLCAEFYRYHAANPHVAEWFVAAARALQREEHRSRYGIGALTEEIRWRVRTGIIKVEGSFKIRNELRACYVRLIVMRCPDLCGLFKINPSIVDELLVIDGRSWSDFAKEHHADLWPDVRRKPSQSVRVVERAA